MYYECSEKLYACIEICTTCIVIVRCYFSGCYKLCNMCVEEEFN